VPCCRVVKKVLSVYQLRWGGSQTNGGMKGPGVNEVLAANCLDSGPHGRSKKNKTVRPEAQRLTAPWIFSTVYASCGLTALDKATAIRWLREDPCFNQHLSRRDVVDSDLWSGDEKMFFGPAEDGGGGTTLSRT